MLLFCLRHSAEEYATATPVSASAQEWIDAWSGGAATTVGGAAKIKTSSDAVSFVAALKPVPWRKKAAAAAAAVDNEGRGGGGSQKMRAAFFDLDGTIVSSNIVMQYVVARLAGLALFTTLFYTVKTRFDW